MSTTTTNLGLFKYDTSTDAQLAFNINQALNGNWDILDKSTLNGDIITLGSSGTQSLTNNRIHKITCNGNTTFSLPTGSGTEFKEIVVLLYMPTAYSISLGTSVYFGDSAPDMSNSGYYTIIYEYDPIRSSWVVGVLPKDTDGSTPIEYPWTQPLLAANGTVGGNNFAVFASSETGNYKAFQPFSASPLDNVGWSANGSMPQYIGWYNPEKLIVKNIKVQNRLDYAGYMPRGGNVYGSNDNSNYTLITTYTNSNLNAGGEWNIDLSSNNNAYNYYKLEVTSTEGYYLNIYKITLTATYLG